MHKRAVEPFDNGMVEADEVLREIQAPLEAISNLSFLAAHDAQHPAKVQHYLTGLDRELEQIGERLRQYFRQTNRR